MGGGQAGEQTQQGGLTRAVFAQDKRDGAMGSSDRLIRCAGQAWVPKVLETVGELGGECGMPMQIPPLRLTEQQKCGVLTLKLRWTTVCSALAGGEGEGLVAGGVGGVWLEPLGAGAYLLAHLAWSCVAWNTPSRP